MPIKVIRAPIVMSENEIRAEMRRLSKVKYMKKNLSKKDAIKNVPIHIKTTPMGIKEYGGFSSTKELRDVWIFKIISSAIFDLRKPVFLNALYPFINLSSMQTASFIATILLVLSIVNKIEN